MNDVPMDAVPTQTSAAAPQASAIFFDGQSSRRRRVQLTFTDRLEISEDGSPPLFWDYADIRRADSPAGTLRVSCQTAPPLARLEIADADLSAALISRCAALDANAHGRGVAVIVGWSLAATLSIVLVVLFGVPYAADRLAPLVPAGIERRVGDAANVQVHAMFGGKTCGAAAGQAAFAKLMDRLREAAELPGPVQAAVVSTPVPNAFALPGGRVYLLSGLLARAANADELAGVLAHELGHLKHRDNMRELIYRGGTSFLIGLLFGDVTGSSALIFASRSLVTASYSREAEEGADTFSIEVMHRLGRPASAMGELMFRITGKEVDKTLSILASHPLSEDRLQRMRAADRPVSGPPLLNADEWTSLKAICGGGN
ncbi:M48 family metallopeptidase [Bradyrhizobium sp. NP1]|uniref:M48 family metallopeptidase n=1 Tax=Bradyrhizobium sp. NP1 TaxID=3049772 RepID=UPI0025A625AF|nr:M48 family metallopeptidase [Bradyrhizobium sp. NP1]WJR77362.1 M48 family metallopeptidase [Bradyrhizobium sp. NP1]